MDDTVGYEVARVGPRSSSSSGVLGRSVALTTDGDGTVVRLVVRGRWDWRLCLATRTAAHVAVAARPAVLELDLVELDDVGSASLPLLVAVRRACARRRPHVRLRLAVAPGSSLARRLDRLGGPAFLPCTTASRVVGQPAEQPAALAIEVQLVPAAAATPATAGAFAARACRSWQLPAQVGRRARVVMASLVRSIEEPQTDLTLTVVSRDGLLHLAVRYSGATPHCWSGAALTDVEPSPRLAGGSHEIRAAHEGGASREVVETVTSYGAAPTHDGHGRVVWATLRS